MNHEFPCTEPIATEVRIGAGTLEVTATQRANATVTIEPLDGSQASLEAAEQARVNFKPGRQLLIDTGDYNGWRMFRRAKLRVRVELPLDCTLTLKVATADVHCTGRYRDVVANTASGDVTIEDVIGHTSVNSASGDVQIGQVGADLRVNTASGDVKVGRVGGSVTGHSASGDVQIGQVGADAKIATASGDVSIGVLHVGEVRANTASGDISLGIAAGTGVWMDVQTMSGRTHTDLSMGGDQSPVPGAPTLNLKARTASGDVTLRRVTIPAAS